MVIQYIAGNITSNVRELEGTLIKLIASSSFTGRDITLEVAQELCGDAISAKKERISIRRIQQKVADSFGISANQLTAHTETRCFLPPLDSHVPLQKAHLPILRSIGLDFGGRDYSTVIHSSRRSTANLADQELAGK